MTDRFVSEEIPFQMIGNRRALTGMMILQNPWVQDFVKQFPNSWEPAIYQDALLFIEPKDDA